MTFSFLLHRLLHRPLHRVCADGLAALTLLILSAQTAAADDKTLFGASVGAAGHIDGHNVHKFSVSASRALPLLQTTPGSTWSLTLRLRASLGAYRADGGSAALTASLGPELSLRNARLPVSLDLGVAPTFIGRDQFGGVDLGGQFHFTSHLGLTLALGRCCALRYRIEHLSNASIESRNPGLNLHVVEFVYR